VIEAHKPYVRFHIPHEPSERGRLAGPDRPRQDDNAPARANPAEEGRVSFLTARARVENAWVGGDAKRLFSAPKMVGMHGPGKKPQSPGILKSVDG
jgi:hypothetical protein